MRDGTDFDRFDLSKREYPQSWYLLDIVDESPRLRGQEVVDLSPGAIELRKAARKLREFAEAQDRWVQVRDESNLPGLSEGHRRQLSFGPSVRYCVEHDTSEEIHGGKPFRHLFLSRDSRRLTPATSAEIGLYFYGRRPAVFAYTRRDHVHGFIGLDWEPLAREDLRQLLEREMGERGE